MLAGEYLLQRLRMRFNTGHDAAHRAKTQIHQPLRRGADQHHHPLETACGILAAENLPRGDIALRGGPRVMHPYFPLAIGRHGEVTDADILYPHTFLRRGSDKIIALLHAHAQRFRGERGHHLVSHAHQHRHAPHHAIRIGYKRQQAITRRRRLQQGQGGHGTGKIVKKR